MIEGEQLTEHDELFLKMKILFAGWRPISKQTDSARQFFTNGILFKAYSFVLELRELLTGYRDLQRREEKQKQLENAEKFIEENGDPSLGASVPMSLREVKALRDQIKVISPYQYKISKEEKGVFDNLQNFLDVPNGIRRQHLGKSKQLLPMVFHNLTERTTIKKELESDLKETAKYYDMIMEEVTMKVNVKNRGVKFYNEVCKKVEDEFSDL